MTTREPGASDALTVALTVRPLSTAFFASKPAASMTLGLLVLVQLVMAAISTEPWPMETLPLPFDRNIHAHFAEFFGLHAKTIFRDRLAERS